MEILKIFNVTNINLFQPDMGLGYPDNHSKLSSSKVEVSNVTDKEGSC